MEWKDADGTLGSLKAHGMGLRGHCGRPGLTCANSKVLDLDKLIERLGADFIYINETRISKALRCERCGYRGGSVTVVANTKPNPYQRAKGI